MTILYLKAFLDINWLTDKPILNTYVCDHITLCRPRILQTLYRPNHCSQDLTTIVNVLKLVNQVDWAKPLSNYTFLTQRPWIAIVRYSPFYSVSWIPLSLFLMIQTCNLYSFGIKTIDQMLWLLSSQIKMLYFLKILWSYLDWADLLSVSRRYFGVKFSSERI